MNASNSSVVAQGERVTEDVDGANISAGTISDLRFIFNDIGIPLVCGFGILGNILNLIILSHQYRRRNFGSMERSAHIGLISLAISDMMACILMLTYIVLNLGETFHSKSPKLYFRWISPSVITFFMVASTWLIVSMAAERYIAVCHPLKARMVITMRRTLIGIFCVYVLAGLAATLNFMFYELKTENTNSTISYSLEKNEEIYKKGRLPWSVFIDFIPCILLLFFNVCLIRQLRASLRLGRTCASDGRTRSYQRVYGNACVKPDFQKELSSYLNPNSTTASDRKASLHSVNSSYSESRPINGTSSGNKHINTRQRSYHSATISLIAVVIMYLVLVSPVEFLKFIVYTYNIRDRRLDMTYAVTNFMQAVNYSFNFVLYVAVNKSFRRTFARLFLCKTPPHENNSHSTRGV